VNSSINEPERSKRREGGRSSFVPDDAARRMGYTPTLRKDYVPSSSSTSSSSSSSSSASRVSSASSSHSSSHPQIPKAGSSSSSSSLYSPFSAKWGDKSEFIDQFKAFEDDEKSRGLWNGREASWQRFRQARDAGEIDYLDHKHTHHLDYKHSIDNRSRSYSHHPVHIPSLRIDRWQRRDEDTESVGDGELEGDSDGRGGEDEDDELDEQLEEDTRRSNEERLERELEEAMELSRREEEKREREREKKRRDGLGDRD